MTLAGARRPHADEVAHGPEVEARARGCPACGCRIRRPRFNAGGYDYVECPGCGLAHLDPLPAEHEARAVFDASYFTGGLAGGYDDYLADESLHRENARLRLEMLQGFGLSPPANVLDVGCAHGFFLDEARARGWTVSGIDVSEAASAYAATRFGLDVVSEIGRARGDGGAPYDVVTLFQVLEHVASPLHLLRDVHDVLRPDGALVLETWDRSSAVARLMRSHWQEVAPPSVVWLWDRQSITLLLAAAGFDLVVTRRSAKRVSLRFVTSLLDDRGGALGRVGHLVGAHARRDRSFLYRLGDLITVTAIPACGDDGQPATGTPTRRAKRDTERSRTSIGP